MARNRVTTDYFPIDRLAGRDNYQLVAVGARGDLPEEMGTKACVEERTTEWRHLE